MENVKRTRREIGFAAACVALSLTSCSLLVDSNGLSDGANALDGGSGEGGAADRCKHAHGSPMVDRKTYCIDQYEVTVADFRIFRGDSSFDPGDPPNGCSARDVDYTDVDPPDRPVHDVTWCGARVFCKWAGKRLCGKIGGGDLDYASAADPFRSEWFAACAASGGKRPYSGGYRPGVCNFHDDTVGDPLTAVGSLKQCVTADGVFDMIGNVAEWINACEPTEGGTGVDCAGIGGSAFQDGSNIDCGFSLENPRSFRTSDRGFRCCSDPM